MVGFSEDSESLVRFASWASCIEVEMGRSNVEGVVSWLSNRFHQYYSGDWRQKRLVKCGSLSQYLHNIG